MIKSKLPEPVNPLREAMDGWEQMRADLMIAQDQVRELTSCNAQLLNEVDFLRSELSRRTIAGDRYQRYAVDLTTRLSIIKEAIIAAESASREYAMKPPVPDQTTEMPPEQVEEVQALISRLPQNAYQ